MTVKKKKNRKRPALERTVKGQKEELDEMRMYIDALYETVLKNNHTQKHE